VKLSDILALLFVAALVGAVFLARRKANAKIAAALSAAYAAGGRAAAAAVSSARVDLGGVHFGNGQRVYANDTRADQYDIDYDRGAGSGNGRGLPGYVDSGVSADGLRTAAADDELTSGDDGAALVRGDAAYEFAGSGGASSLNLCPYCFAPFPSRAKVITHCHLSHSDRVVGDPREKQFFDVGERR